MRASKIAVATLVAGFWLASDAAAVTLNPDGLGQALIYPYYTARSPGENPFNTYVSVANTDSLGKVVRVRLREGGNAREVAGFNLFLRPGDMWTGAIVPDGEGAKLITSDASCTDPVFAGTGLTELAFSSAAYSGTNSDGGGEGRDRTREGYLEMIEMASVRAGSPTAGAACAQLRATPSIVPADVAAPRGGLMGTLTIINVTSGLDATLNATALASLSTQPFFRPAADPYPDFDSAEVTPSSTITTAGKRYRLAWSRGVDAVSSVLMQASTTTEYILDNGWDALSDIVITTPTRRFYRTDTVPAPFSVRAEGACWVFFYENYDGNARREQFDYPFFGPRAPSPPATCRASTVASIQNGASHMGRPLLGPPITATTPYEGTLMPVHATYQNGWLDLLFDDPLAPTAGLVSLPASSATAFGSLPGSSATDLAAAATMLGAFRVRGLPILGFVMRTLSFGTRTCGAGACQGNYASAFPLVGRRSILAAP
jgi:hypothetical protein